ncbi:unnamed protein product [Chironomus riparius]|uniref:Uncharacterized protein n=1 Tax=Chironomus riparius TaxID=315576 RepID=A0A9N9RVS5_9DIPT|nr:unnamed protein product [Chironomus riparius]
MVGKRQSKYLELVKSEFLTYFEQSGHIVDDKIEEFVKKILPTFNQDKPKSSMVFRSSLKTEFIYNGSCIKAIAEMNKEEPIGTKTSSEDDGKSGSQNSFDPTNGQSNEQSNGQSSTIPPDLSEVFESSSQEYMHDVFNEGQTEISSYSDMQKMQKMLTF